MTFRSEREVLLSELFHTAYEKGIFNGCAIICEKDEVLYHCAIGMADFAKGRALDLDTVFELASVSKQFTAAAVLKLRDSKKLSLEDPLEKYFPGIPYKGRTIKMLLNHTSGLPDYMEWCVSLGKIAENQDVVRFIMERRIAERFKPLSNWEYCNTAYVLLAVIVEMVSGKCFSDYLEHELFIPAGMMNTKIYNRRKNGISIENYAYGYIDEGLGPILPDHSITCSDVVFLDGIQGDGTVNSNIQDMLLWDKALRSADIISVDSQYEAYSPTKYGDGLLNQYPYGYGWFIRNGLDGKVVEHGGGWPGYKTEFVRNLDNHTCIVLLCNYPRDSRAMHTLLGICEDIVAHREHEPLSSTSELVDRSFDTTIYPTLTGNFEGGISVETDDGKLYLISPYMASELLPIGNKRFVSPDMLMEIVISQNGIEYHDGFKTVFAKSLK